MLEDRWLVMRLRRGSRDAFGRIYQKYRSDLLALAISLARDRARAEDALHDAFVGLARTAPRLRPTVNLKAYLATAVANRVRNQFRDGQREDVMENPPASAAESDDAPDRRSMLADDLRCVARALEELPDDQREVIVLHLLHGLRFRDVAAGLDLSINTVQSRYRYGLAKLRSTLQEVLDHEVARIH